MDSELLFLRRETRRGNKRRWFSRVMSRQGESQGEKVDICPDSCHSSRREFWCSAEARCDSQGRKRFQSAALTRTKQENMNIWAFLKMKGCLVIDKLQFRVHHGYYVNWALCVAFLLWLLDFIVNLVKMFNCATSGQQSNVMEPIYLCDDRMLILDLESSAKRPTVHQQTWDTTFPAKPFYRYCGDHPSGWNLHSHFDFIEGCSLNLMSWQIFGV